MCTPITTPLTCGNACRSHRATPRSHPAAGLAQLPVDRVGRGVVRSVGRLGPQGSEVGDLRGSPRDGVRVLRSVGMRLGADG